MNTQRLLLRQMLVLVLVVGIVACSQTSPPQASKTPTVETSSPIKIATPLPALSPTPLGGASAKLGPVPQDCPPGPAPKDVVSNTGSVVGDSPVWAGGFVGPHAQLVWFSQQAEQLHNQYGWPHKLLWVVADSVKGLVTIHGANLPDGSPLRPDAEQEAATSTPTTLVLYPQDPNLINHADQWVEFPGSLTIPKAGCYYLEATWPGGSWRITFAAGVVPSNG